MPGALTSRQPQQVLVRGRGFWQQLVALLVQGRRMSQQQQMLVVMVVLQQSWYPTQSPRMPVVVQARALPGCQIHSTAHASLLYQTSVPHSLRLSELRILGSTTCSRRWRGSGQTGAKSLRHSQRALCSLSKTLLLLMAVRTSSSRGVARRRLFLVAVRSTSSRPVQGRSQQPWLSLLAMALPCRVTQLELLHATASQQRQPAGRQPAVRQAPAASSLHPQALLPEPPC